MIAGVSQKTSFVNLSMTCIQRAAARSSPLSIPDVDARGLITAAAWKKKQRKRRRRARGLAEIYGGAAPPGAAP
ncbi:unnamed protein product [Parnassius apollo]|uniref:(apollo) hypothetical protein n=1 Tax=Parnassius apollo TaxID=110799 RepID=A0A8S3WXG1_PARAO|nr:unnamed protein product [Parnassius apollo]